MKILRQLAFLASFAALPVAAQNTEFGNLLVTQNDAGNASTSITLAKGAGSSPNFDIRPGSTKADYTITFGTANDYQAGVLVASVAENGRNNNAFGETIGTFYTTVGVELDSTTAPTRYYLALFRSPNAEEQNVNVSCAFLPYSQWLGGTARNGANGNGGATDTLQASAGINLGVEFTAPGTGLFGLNLTSINAAYTAQNGILLVNHLKNEDNYAASRANGDGSFSMFVRDNGSTGSGNEQDPIAFAYIPAADVGSKFLKAVGRVNNDATTDVAGGTFSVTKGGTGQWFLTIPGMSPEKGVLVVSPEGGGTNNTDNIVSYQWDAGNTLYVIESRDIVSTTAVPVLEDGATADEDMFSFAFFEAPIVPVVAITSPATGASVVTGTAFDIEVDANDANGTITQVEFLRNGVVVGTDTVAPWAFNQAALSVGTYTFTARATDNDGFANTSAPVSVSVTLDPGNLPANTALWFDGVNDYVTMGTAIDLGLGGPPTNGMTLECWFRKDGAGLTSSSGSGGVTAVPLFGKGRGEGDGNNVDCNYFFGITTAGILVADFETYPAAGLTAGQNYPITGTNTPIVNGEWHHAAVTYDGPTATWTMYLDGTAVGTATAAAGALPRYDSIQHFGIATAMTSAGAREGAFHGIIDEVRVWNYARSGVEIASTKDISVTSSPGLVGRYGLNEGIGSTTDSSTGTSQGTLTNGPLWIEGATLVTNDPPTIAISAPADNTNLNAPASFSITATASDPDGTISKVEFFEGATKLGEDATAPYSFEVNALAQGDYAFTTRATDNFGAFTDSAVITVHVLPPLTTPPTVSITAPADMTTFLAPATITINANAADSDGTVTKVEFFSGATKLGEDTLAPFSFDWTNVAVGNYSLTVKATDDMTATTTSAAILVNVIVNQDPSILLTSPNDLATNVGAGGAVMLSADVADPESQSMNVTFYGRPKSPPVGPDFTLVTLPDTQFYSENTGGTRLANFTSQTNWIVANRTTGNIPFVAHMGDMVQNGDSVQQEWINADGAMAIIEDPLTTLLTHGIPWGGAPGNHDQQPIGSPDGASVQWNTYFGAARWAGRPYWGGNYGTNNDNNYQLFSASGLDFVVVNMEYRPSANQGVLDWADSVLKAFPNRRAIVTSHWLIGTGNPAAWGGHGQAVYDNLKDNPNLFLMLCGHIHGEGQRSDTFEGRTVYTVLQDYQSRANGGDSWLRYFVFSPANNTISAKTLQTTTGTFETDADSQFVLPYTMGAGSASWVPLGTVSASGGSASLEWTGVAGDTEYEWYAAVSDGTNNIGSTTRSFTTATNALPTVAITQPTEGAIIPLPAEVQFAVTASDADGGITKVEFYAGSEKVGEDASSPYTLSWAAVSGAYALTAVAYDNQGATSTSAAVNITVTNPSNQLPTVQLTSLAGGARLATTLATLTASAADVDGLVAKVEFFDGVTKIGEDTTAPYSFDWAGGTEGQHTLTAVATDNDGGVQTSAAVMVTLVVPESLTLIAKGASWKYLDDGSDQGTAWKEAAFVDTAWASGPAPLGYGDTHIVTTVNSGPSGNRIITTYLRRTFEVADASSVVALALNLMRDDGAVIYINGTEVARSNMPAGVINYLTNSADTVSGTDETTYLPLLATTLPLVDGTNSIAVELHNRDGASSDLGFDLEVVATQLPPAPLPELIVTEINSNATGGDFWELTNVGATIVDVGNWKWDDDSANPNDAAAVTIPSGTVIAPGESIVLTTAADAAAFRTVWSIAPTVQVIASPTGPGFGQNDQVHLFDGSGATVTSFSYVAGGFTLSSGSASIGGHAGASAGGTATQSAVIDPVFGYGAGRRYMAANGTPGASGLSFGGGPSITLSLSVTPSSFSESAANPAATGTVSRATSGTSDLVITLSSSDTTEATVPATVTILADQTSANFDVTAVNDTFPDGNKTVTITASATDATTPTFDVTVQDDGDVLQNNLMLTEVLSQQAATGVNDFWELTNISGSAVSLAGYSWHDNGRSAAAAAAYALPGGSSIAPGESVIFTTITPAAFRAWWGISESVQVFQTVGAPGLGQNDGVALFDNGGNELFFFSYGVGGFTKADGNPSTGTHSGPSAGAATETQSAVWDPASGTTTPRYTFASVGSLGCFASAANAADVGSPGVTVGNPTVSIASASINEGDSGTTLLSLPVTRSDIATAFTVDYAVTGGTATSGTDFATLASGTLTFTDGGTASQNIDITVNGDTASESDETVIITLSNLVNTTGASVISNAEGIGTIINDDIVPPAITTQPTGATIATGYTATLSLVATGTPAPAIQWYEGTSGTTTTPVGTNSPTFTTPALSATTSYWARVTNAGGSVDSDTAIITVTPGVASVDLSTYVRVARINLPEYRRTPLPPGTAAHNLLCDEASGVAYNWDTDTLFICGDGGRAITQVTKTGQLIDTMSLELNAGNPQGTEFYDPEGITYIGGGQFVFSEERERRLVKFTYVAGTTLTRAAAQTVDLGTFDDNTGTEGLSYDPQTSGFIVLKEKAPIGVFQTGVDFAAGTATNGSASTVNSTNLFDTTLLGMTDVADVFAFSNIPSMIGQPQAGNMLIIGQENARILNVDRSGNILSTLNISSDPGNPLSAADQQHEGVTMDRAGIIYVVNENGGGSIEYPQLWVYAPSSLPNQAPTAITLNNEVNSLEENTSTASPIKVADVVVTDDGLGNNELSLTGADAASFQLTGSSLFVKAGVVLDFETKTSYAVTINADDTTVGATPDATYNFTLNITDQVVETPTPPALIVTEVAPWASSNGAVGGDWFEVTNVSASAVDITGWKVDDSSNAFATAIALNGITSIAPGESVIFIEGAAGIADTFKTVWFGASPPVGLQVGTYQGSGIGLSTGGDAVNLFTAGGTRHSGATFGAADSASPFQTFDNTAAANDSAITLLSEDGVNGAFVAATSAVEIGSPGYSAPGVLRVTEVAPWSSGSSPVAADWFEVTNIGARSVDITGWKVDDGSESPAAALPLTGITSIAPGESVIFIETATLSTKKAEFLANWFGASPPATLQVGAYSGGGIGLSTGGDALNLYDTNNVRVANVSFGIAPSTAPFTTFDNAAALNVAAITQFSAVGVNGAFIAANSSSEVGSPGSIQTAIVDDAAVSIADVSVEEGNGGSTLLTFTVTRSHNQGAFSVDYGTADGSATAPADYTAATGTVTFTADGDLSATISVTIIGDSIVEPDETFTVGLLNLVSTAGTAVLSDTVATGTIQNDDVYFPPTGALSVSNLGFLTMPFGAEIPAFDPASKRAFVSSNSGVQIVDLSDPAVPTLVSTIAPASLGVAAITSNDVSSVAVRKGYGANPAVVAVAIINSPKTQSGQVVFLNAATGALLGSVAVGAVPDNLTFTPDGSKVLVAIEGEMDGTAADPVEDTTQGGVAIIDVSGGFSAPTVTFANFAAYDSQVNALVTAGVRIFSKVVDVAGTPTRVYAAPSVDFEAEYVAVSPDGTKAMVTLQEANALAILDIATATFTSVVPLGEKDFSTLLADFSDRDGPGGTASINLTTGNPVFGMYMPDAIASYQVGGQVYYVTANEGDDRNDFLTPDESTTVGNAGYDLDDAIFPNEVTLKDPAALGRLVTSNASGLRGDTDGDGDIDRILSYGARSFSIHDASGARVFDSADMIEKIVATQFPANFFDSRSDNKGPEPEGVTVASLGGRTYAFVGLERSHMVLIFDVTNPAAVSYAGGAVRQGDLNPEGLVVVPAAESPTGRALLLVTSEDSNTLSVFELGQPAANFTLQLLHLSDGEAGLLASQTAPNLAALVDAFDDRYENTLIVSGGDNFIPSPFLNAGTDPLLNSVPWIGKTNFARPDIAIHNLLGVEASGIGNHEWDLGTNVFMDAIRPDGAWSGALFPHVSVNLDYSQDSAALARFTDVPLNGATTPVPAASGGASRLVPMAVVNKGGEKIGVLGVTTQILRAISSPSGTFAKGYPAGTTGADDMNLLASQLQPYVNELIAEGVNKIVLLSHLQQISNEQLLATKLTGVDIIVAAGSNTRLGDSDDVATAFPGHAANFADDYPLVLAGADGKPVLIVCTDNEYTYLGRLVVEFDGNGDLLVSNLAARVAENGAYAATTEQVAAVWGVSEADLEATAFAPGTKGARVKAVTEAVQMVIDAKDGTVYGYTAVYLEGERAFVRGQETNLGNITADANQQALRAIIGGTDPIVSLKNGGGIRAQIGAVSSLGGSAEKLPPPANPVVGKSEGGISQLDIENALRFNNRLMAFETTPAGLKAILEHGVASWPNQGRFPQIGGVAFAWDPTRASGNRVTSIALMNDDGTPGAAIYKEGPLSAAILRAAPPVIRMVTLNFLANDGDGYPMKANGTNFRYVLDDGSLGPVITDEGLNFTVSPQLPSNALGEQAAFATLLQTRHGSLATAFRQADTPASGDERIQIATFRSDTVPPMLTADTDGDGIADVVEDLIGLDSESGIRIGETLTMDLSPLAGTGSVLRLVGRLPAGLRFNPATGLITGQLLGLPGSYPVQIQELVNGRIVATQWLNFEIDAFPAGLLGGFEVLLEDTSEAPRGIVRLSVTKAGAWSASLDFAGASRRQSRGTFTLVDGTKAGITAAFPATRGIPAMTVNLLLDATTPLVQATYLSGVESGSGRGFRLVDRSSSVPLTQKLTMTLDAGVQDGVAYPAGIGWAKGSAGVTGTVSMSGSLGDAQSVRLGLKLSRTGQAVVWSQPYRNKTSYLGGIVPLAGLGQPLPFPQRQVEGLRWFKAADSRELSYEAGFAMPLEVTAASSRWDRPASATLLATALGLTDSTLAVEISGAGLSNATPVAPVLPTSFVMSSRYALTTAAPLAPAPVPWAGAVRYVDGGFSGLLTLPVGASNLAGRSAVSGVLLTDPAFGSTVGGGLQKVAVSGKRGAFRTASVLLKQ